MRIVIDPHPEFSPIIAAEHSALASDGADKIEGGNIRIRRGFAEAKGVDLAGGGELDEGLAGIG